MHDEIMDGFSAIGDSSLADGRPDERSTDSSRQNTRVALDTVQTTVNLPPINGRVQSTPLETFLVILYWFSNPNSLHFDS